MTTDADRSTIPLGSLVFGYGPMAPFVAAAIGAWFLPPPWLALSTRLAIIWGGIILAFLAGVRRGFGFGNADASTVREIATMLIYFVLGGSSLVFASIDQLALALLVQVIGFIMVPMLDRRAAFTGDAPRYFARLRVPQMTIAVAALVALLGRLWFAA
jgi:hypothetical protein